MERENQAAFDSGRGRSTQIIRCIKDGFRMLGSWRERPSGDIEHALDGLDDLSHRLGPLGRVLGQHLLDKRAE